MKKLLIGIFVILVLLVAAVVTLPQLVPASAYKNKIEEQVSAALARDVTIAGDVKLKVFPSIVASAQTVTIANAAGFDAEPFAQMRSLDANVKLMPLLSRKIEIGAFTLTEPKIRLTRKKNGDVNWAFGAQDTKPKDSGPFQRDGRFSDMDISLGKFEISNGEITYSDQQSGQQTQLTAVNIDAAIPNLNAPVKLAGDLLFDSEPAKFSVSLDTPSAFLNGKVAPMAVSLEMNPADISINGQFLPGTEIGFDANVSAIVRDASALAAMAGQSNDALALANSGAFEGQLKYGKDGVTVSNANITAKGPALDARYTGDVSMHADTPRASGALSLNANDIRKITAALGIDVPQLAAVSSVSMTGDFKADGPVTRGSNIDLKVGGDGFDAQYSGGLVFDKVAVLDGEFSANAQSLPELPAKFGITDLPAALAALGSGSVRGKINGTSGDLRLSALDLKTESALISAAYRGSANVGKTQTLNGTFDATIPSMPKLAETADFKHPQIAALGALSVKGDVSGAPADLTLSNLDTRLSDGILNLAYQGGASVKGSNVQYNGKLGADITSLRKLASLSGGESPFPPSTDAGAIFERASVNGTAIGNLAGAKFSQADVKFDGMAGKGDFDVSLNGARPMIKGDLKIGEMDMRPYMAAYAAQNPTGKIRPWSEKPLDMTVLQSFDADLKASAESLNTGRMNMGSTDMTAKVSTGILTIDIRALSYMAGSDASTQRLTAANRQRKSQ